MACGLSTSGPSGSHHPAAWDSTVSVPLTRTPRLLKGRACQSRLGRVEHTGQDTQSCAQMVPQLPSTPSLVPGGLPSSSTVCRSSARNIHFCPAGPAAWRSRVGGALLGCRVGPRPEEPYSSGESRGEREPWACRCGRGPEGQGPGGRSAAVVDPEALGDLLAAQRAGAQRLAALQAAADVATVEEDHLGLRRERSVWALPLVVLSLSTIQKHATQQGNA